MSVPKVLLIAGVLPDAKSVGGIFLHDLCLHYPRNSLCCFALNLSGNKSLPDELGWMPIVYASRPRESICYAGGVRHLSELRLQYLKKIILGIAPVINFFIWQRAKSHIDDLIEQAVEFGRQKHIDLVWVALQSPILIYISRRIAHALGARLVSTVWDPPEYWLPKSLYLDRLSILFILREFAKTIKASERVGVASDNMKMEYEKKYGVEAVTMIHGITPDMRKLPSDSPINKDQFTIGFAGNMYAINEWKSLVSALSRVNWSIDGKKISILLIGRCESLIVGYEDHIKCVGWRSIGETINLLSSIDATYLPYWFDESYQIAVRQCFPNKLTTYLASGKPVLFHGPSDSSPALFLRQFPAGICCHSLKEKEIIECISRLSTDMRLYATSVSAGQNALDHELNIDVFLERFARLLRIDAKDLFLTES